MLYVFLARYALGSLDSGRDVALSNEYGTRSFEIRVFFRVLFALLATMSVE